MNHNAKWIIRTSLMFLFGFVIIGYSLYQGNKIISGPIIDIYVPQNGATYNSPLIEIQGRARNVSYLNLDGRGIFTDKNGYFKEQLLLSPGYNILTLDARDKFNTEVVKHLELILKEY